jgi:hypothetical protein
LAGCQTPDLVFLTEARKTVHQLTDGIPRIVHQLCQQALAHAAELDLPHVDETVVQTAWEILQQLPITGNSIQKTGFHDTDDETSFIEFGMLDEDDSVATINAVRSFDEAPYPEPLMPETHQAETASELEAEFAKTFSFPSPKFDLANLGRVLSDKATPDKKQPEVHQRESCQKLLDELSIMEQLLTEEISVINKMKKIESDCLSRRVRRVFPTEILAGFPEIPRQK